MDSGYYAACTALKTQASALELAANNIANVNTTGYRGQMPSFHSMLVASSSKPQSGWNRLVNEFAVLDGARLDLGQGNLEHTGNPLDLALEGPGFFAVETTAGTLYTRNGSFRVSASGQLVTSAGDPVLGASGPVNFLDGVPGGEVAISSDGTISVGGAVAGKLRIVAFDSKTQLTPAGSLREIGFFDSGSDEIKSSSQPAFARLAAILQQTQSDIRVEGHTDNVPIHNSRFRSNWDLSTARATATVRLLVEHYGFTPERIAVSGYAEYRPIASNDSAEGRAQNRRVDIVIPRKQSNP